jgi:alanine-glyoxylate transaminase/serine-glyoxylate transaminase/serine-pyruvate transaminase
MSTATTRATISVPDRLLLGSGPSPVPRRILEALSQPTIGHLDPAFGALMDDVAAGLRATFRTKNAVAIPVSGTGSAGMEAMVANLVRPGDRVICGVHGLFGERMADELARHGAEVVRVEAEWGRAIPTEALLDAAAEPFAAMFVVHAETSTGVAQPLDGLADACRDKDALLLVDCVTSLGGHPLDLDAAGVDAAFSGTQKCLNAPPGLAPFTVGERALGRVKDGRVPSWYFDLSLVLGYWLKEEGAPRAYHHTAPINLVYALAEALAIVAEEGLEARWNRHAVAHDALRDALAVLGLERLAPEGEQLHPLLAVRLPDGVEDAKVRVPLLTEDGIEISGGLGPLAGRIWRIGVMGEGARLEPQERLVRALGARLGGDVDGAVGALKAGWAS